MQSTTCNQLNIAPGLAETHYQTNLGLTLNIFKQRNYSELLTLLYSGNCKQNLHNVLTFSRYVRLVI